MVTPSCVADLDDGELRDDEEPVHGHDEEDAEELEENYIRRLPLGGDGIAQQRGIDGRMHEKIRRARDHGPRASKAGKVRLRDYQLDLVTPGIIPCVASSRKAMRESLNRRMNERRRPLVWHRLVTRVGLAFRGSCVRPT
jgi:hypothetical protein